MKSLIITSLCLFSVSSFSADKMHDQHHKDMMKKMDKMSYEDAKKMHLEMLDKKTTMIEDERKCINDTKDKNGLKDCMKKMHEEWKDKKEEMKEDMKEDMKK